MRKLTQEVAYRDPTHRSPARSRATAEPECWRVADHAPNPRLDASLRVAHSTPGLTHQPHKNEHHTPPSKNP